MSGDFMSTNMVITTKRGKVYVSEALAGIKPDDAEQVRQQLERFDKNGWHAFKSGGKVAYIRASTIESIELWEGEK